MLQAELNDQGADNTTSVYLEGFANGIIYYGKAIERYEGLRLRLPTPDPESSRQASYGVSRSFQLHTPPISGCVR